MILVHRAFQHSAGYLATRILVAVKLMTTTRSFYAALLVLLSIKLSLPALARRQVHADRIALDLAI